MNWQLKLLDCLILYNSRLLETTDYLSIMFDRPCRHRRWISPSQSGTAAGIYAIRRLQADSVGELETRACLALGCCQNVTEKSLHLGKGQQTGKGQRWRARDKGLPRSRLLPGKNDNAHRETDGRCWDGSG